MLQGRGHSRRNTELVLATGNRGKLVEIERILTASGLPESVQLRAQWEFNVVPAVESGATFLDNALLKARHVAAATGRIAVADDSGLAVDVLDGEPGVHTARYAGPAASDADNINKLLLALTEIPTNQRGASFHCVAVVAFPGEALPPLVTSATWRGQIALTVSGSGGFGYDPVFYDAALGKCAADMTAEEKNSRSHRGQAFRELAAKLIDHLCAA